MIDQLATMPRPVRDERGSGAVEAALLVPVIVMMIALLAGGGRVWSARAQLADLAGDAVRLAAHADSSHQARADVAALVEASAAPAGCATVEIDLDLSDFGRTPGTAGTVTATLRCTADLTDLLLPGLPGSMVLDATAEAPLDTYRRHR